MEGLSEIRWERGKVGEMEGRWGESEKGRGREGGKGGERERGKS